MPSKNLFKKYDVKPYNSKEQMKFLEDENIIEEEHSKNITKENIRALMPRKEGVLLQEHQIKFIKQFIYSNLHGAVMFHGVGSGKTLTAVVSSYWYLHLYPTHKVLIISPSALLYNFIEGMRQRIRYSR